MTDNQENIVELGIVENGLDFILLGVKNLENKKGTSDLKYGILSLSAGVELLLKARLIKEHWSLIFKNVGDADRIRYKSGDFYGVSLDEAIKRLENICDVKIKEDEIKALRNLKQKRNGIEHFGLNDSTQALISSTIPVIEFVIIFISENFNQGELSRESLELNEKIRARIPYLEEFVIERWKSVELPEDQNIFKCPICGQNAVVVDDDQCNCLFCGYSANGEEFAEKYGENILGYTWRDYRHGSISPICSCPDCGSESFFEIENYGYGCSSCGNIWDYESIDFCSSCGNPYVKNGSLICDDCFEVRKERD